MKRHWLRGILLGVSLALLVAGGVALAQGITITTKPEGCIECSSRAARNYLAVSSSGWLDNESINYEGWKDGEYWGACPACGQAVNGHATDNEFVSFDCVNPERPSGRGGGFVVVAQDGSSDIGSYRFTLTGDQSAREGSFTIEVAEVCEAQFVPEPGTIALLGSGLAGLAGYATLRWRSRR